MLAAGVPLHFELRARDAQGNPVVTREVYSSSELAIVVVDMWDSHPDPAMASRMEALVPRMNQTLDAARRLGIRVIFAPNEVPLPAGADTDLFLVLPRRQQITNGFNPPSAPFKMSKWGDMVPVPYELAHSPRFSKWAKQSPDLIVRPGDLATVRRQQIIDFCAAYGIKRLLYMGVAANMCLFDTREISMVPMWRHGEIRSILVRDLTTAMSLNGRKSTGNNNTVANIDPCMTPDDGDLASVAHIERYVAPSITSLQLMQYQWSAAYGDLIAKDSRLLCYWRMGSGDGDQHIIDVRRNQSCWWNKNDPAQAAGLQCGIPGAVPNDPSTAVQFDGSTTLLISSLYNVDLAHDSPLISLSAQDFSMEMWVRIDRLVNSNQWFYAHDGGTSDGIDVLVGLNANHRFEFVVGRNAASDSPGDIVESAYAVTQTDVDSGRWFYLVAKHDRSGGRVALYLDGEENAWAAESCHPVVLTNAPHFASRGRVVMGSNGRLSNRGFEGFAGALDHVAICSPPLDSDSVRTHYVTGMSIPPSPPPVFVSQTTDSESIMGLTVLGVAGRPYVLQVSGDLNHWQSVSTNIAPVDVFEIFDPETTVYPSRFYRLLELR